jgi:hypothetical protein
VCAEARRHGKDHAVGHAIYGRHGTFGRGVDGWRSAERLTYTSNHSGPSDRVYGARWVESAAKNKEILGDLPPIQSEQPSSHRQPHQRVESITIERQSAGGPYTRHQARECGRIARPLSDSLIDCRGSGRSS